MIDCRSMSCLGRESLALLSIGVSGTKVTGPWSGQSDGYALSHSVHPGDRGSNNRDSKYATAPMVQSDLYQCTSVELLLKAACIQFNLAAVPALIQKMKINHITMVRGALMYISLFLYNSDQTLGSPPAFLIGKLIANTLNYLYRGKQTLGQSSSKLLQNILQFPQRLVVMLMMKEPFSIWS